MYSMPSTELYFRSTCPYCVKVLRFMEAHNITLPMHSIEEEPGAAERLIEIGGKRQVPCLIIDGKALYESDDIIEYLRVHMA